MGTTALYNTINIQVKDLIPFCIGQHRYMGRNLKVYNKMDAHDQIIFERRGFGLTTYASIVNVIIGAVAMFGVLKLSGLDKLLF